MSIEETPCQLCAGTEDVRSFDLERGTVRVCTRCVETMHDVVRRAEIAERLRLGRERAASRDGWVAGTPPYGYRSVRGVLHEVPAELEVAAWMVRQRERGFPWRAIVDELNRAGTPTPRGGRVWGVSSVRRIVNRGGSYPTQGRVHVPMDAGQVEALRAQVDRDPAEG